MTEPCDVRIRRGGWTEDLVRWASNGHRCREPIGPWNTASNLAYAIVGSWVAWRYQDASGAALGVALWLLATGSALYHGYKTLWANRLDWTGMMAVMAALVAHGWLGRFPWASWVMLAAGGAVGWWYLSQKRLHFDWLMAAGLVAASLPLLLWRTPAGLVGLGLAWLAFAAGYLAWQLDKRRSSVVGIYGHALWHCLTAIAIGVLFVAQHR